MFTNELKKGTMVTLSNGWRARLEDNMRGTTRLATVYGTFTEMGSIYSHDIQTAEVNGHTVTVEHSPSEIACRKRVGSMFQ